MSDLVDTHAHLDFPDFDADREQVVQCAADAGVTRIITIGTDLESSRRAVVLAEQYPSVWAVVGWHPGHASEAPPDIRPALCELARHPKVVAIGETGLDYYRLPSKRPGGRPEEDEPYREKQSLLFQQQMEVAAETGLGCVIHQRESLADVLEFWKPNAGQVRAVFHCFGERIEVASEILALGGLVSFTGIVTFKNAEVVRQTVAALPSDGFMLETDCPFLAPVPHRGKRAEPAHVRLIAERVAAIRGETVEAVAEATCRTASRFFDRITGCAQQRRA